jgi:hypothetical protein
MGLLDSNQRPRDYVGDSTMSIQSQGGLLRHIWQRLTARLTANQIY